jgi:two-component system KDP operon response regulator KdpE
LSRADVVIDLARRRVFRGDEELRLSRKEYDLLKMLAMHDGRVITHQQILRAIWGPTHTEDVHYLRILVGHLRRKLGDDPACPQYVHTVQGVGYRFADS